MTKNSCILLPITDIIKLTCSCSIVAVGPSSGLDYQEVGSCSFKSIIGNFFWLYCSKANCGCFKQWCNPQVAKMIR